MSTCPHNKRGSNTRALNFLQGLAVWCRRIPVGIVLISLMTIGIPMCFVACSSTKGSTAYIGQLTKKKKSSGTNGSNKNKNTINDDRVEKPDKNVSDKELASACKKLGVSTSGVKNKQLYTVSAQWVGKPYRYGGNSTSGVDCSGLTNIIIKKVYGKSLQRSSADIYATNINKISKSNLREGDLVFFRTDGKRSKTPNHVGVYLKENKFIHSSTSKGVIVSSMQQKYYVDNFIAAGRIK
ncbi:MAG: C40 family peptidase [Marinilabiliaceae bacterium]